MGGGRGEVEMRGRNDEFREPAEMPNDEFPNAEWLVRGRSGDLPVTARAFGLEFFTPLFPNTLHSTFGNSAFVISPLTPCSVQPPAF